jgi:predicted nucleotidyltransferase
MPMTIPEIKGKIVSTLEKYGVKRASLFGSVVRGDYTERSDIDILVEMPDTATLLDLASLKLDLEDILKRKVDVLTYDSLHPLLKNRIMDEQQAVM